MISSTLLAADQTPAAGLSVQDSSFVLTLESGQILEGLELAGATLHLALGGEHALPVKIISITTDPDQPDILRHEMQIPDGNAGWRSFCEPNSYGETWGFPVKLPADHPGHDGEITLTCASGAVVKCARFGYRPWARGPRGEDLTLLHAACMRMVRADYCGDDVPHTKNGTEIDLYDDLGIQVRATEDDTEFVFEAAWSPDGAVCVNHTRWTDLLSMSQLGEMCPAATKLPLCNEETARALGAKLFNASRILPARE